MKLVQHLDDMASSLAATRGKARNSGRLGKFAALASFSALLSTPALAQAKLEVNNIWNLGSQALVQTANSFPPVTNSFPTPIPSFTFPYGEAGPGGTVMSGTVTYRTGGGTGPGCSFTTTITKVGSSWIFSTSAAKVPSTAVITCKYTRISTGTSTGLLEAEWEVSGY